MKRIEIKPHIVAGDCRIREKLVWTVLYVCAMTDRPRPGLKQVRNLEEERKSSWVLRPVEIRAWYYMHANIRVLNGTRSKTICTTGNRTIDCLPYTQPRISGSFQAEFTTPKCHPNTSLFISQHSHALTAPFATAKAL